jgi:hypothetical protein
VFRGHHAIAGWTLRAGAVKVRSAAERGGGAKRRGLDGAEHSATIQRVMVAKRFLPECGETSASLRRSYRQVVVLAERRLPEIGEDPVQASQGHG